MSVTIGFSSAQGQRPHRGQTRTDCFARIVLALVVTGPFLALGSSPVAAQSSSSNLDLGGHVNVLHLNEFDTTDFGIGVDATRSLAGGLALDGALSLYSGDRQLRRANSFLDRSRVLGLVGLRGGRPSGRVEAFVRGRAGFLRFNGGNEVVCVAIFPTPLACRLAAGYTAFAADVGAGTSIGLSRSDRLRLRLETSDLLVRYDLEVTRPGGDITDGFIGHNLLVTIGLAWRF